MRFTAAFNGLKAARPLNTPAFCPGNFFGGGGSAATAWEDAPGGGWTFAAERFTSSEGKKLKRVFGN
jgi:hypothetical protein